MIGNQVYVPFEPKRLWLHPNGRKGTARPGVVKAEDGDFVVVGFSDGSHRHYHKSNVSYIEIPMRREPCKT